MAKDGEKNNQTDSAGQVGLKCPVCGCKDFRDEDGRPFKTVRTVNVPNAIRRYKICRYCGKKIRTKEIIEIEKK